MAPNTYAEVLARNIRAARARQGLGQESVAARMRALGHDGWVRQTVGSTEKPSRRVTADEIFGLSLVLGTTISRLMAPAEEEKVVDFPDGASISVIAVRLSAVGKLLDGVIQWDGDKPVFTAPKLPPGVFDGLPGTWSPGSEG